MKKATNSFDIFPWINEFDTGIAFIDEQHRTLVRLLNELACNLVIQSESPSPENIFRELGEYAAYHFETEEKLMREYLGGDADVSGHERTHQKFVEEIARLGGQGKTKPVRETVEDVVAFLSLWLANHILNTDQRMAKVVLAVQAGMPLEQAKVRAGLEMSGTIKALTDTVLGIYEKLSSRTIQLMKEIAERNKDRTQHSSMQQIEWNHIQRVLFTHDGNISAAARTLKINRRTLQRKLHKPPNTKK